MKNIKQLLASILVLAIGVLPAEAYNPIPGTTGQWLYNAGNNTFGAQTFSGDCTVVYTTGVVTCTETNGVAFTPSATTALAANQVLGAITSSPSALAVPSCSGATSALTWTTGTGFGCNTISGGGGVSSFTGDGVIINNSASTGAVTDTLVNAAANSVLGNNTASPAAPAYQTSINLTGTAATAAHTITSASANSLVVGANGATNPVLAVDASTASVASGIVIKGAAAGSATTITATDSASNGPLTISSKNDGSLSLIAPGTSSVVILNASSASTGGIDELQIGGTNHFTQSAATTSISPAAESSTPNNHLIYTGAADTALTASTESVSELWNNSQVRQHSTGALALQRDFVVTGSTDSFTAASALTDAATLGFSLPGCGTNATCTDLNGIFHASTALTVTGTTTNSYIINVAADTGATNNYAANFVGPTIINSSSAKALSVGANGITNPTLLVNDNTASDATGISITGAAAGSGVALATISSGSAENMTIDAKSTGTIGIGTISTGAVTIGNVVNMPGLASSSAGTTGTVCWTTSSGLLNVDTTTSCLLSLEELKDKHGPITNALDTIKKIEPFWFTWKHETPEWAGDKAEQPGMGAHQIESVDPRLAAYTPQGKLKGVRYQEMTAVLVAAVKEQQEEIEHLKLKALPIHPCLFNLLMCPD